MCFENIWPHKKIDVLAEARRLTEGDRQQQYGKASVDFTRTAKMWSAILGVEVTSEQAIMCMVALKLSRQCNKPKADNVIDGIGYFKILQDVIDEKS